MKAESETNVPAKRPKLCSEDDKTVIDTIMEFQPISFFLTKVAGIDDKFNMTGTVSLKGRFFNDKKKETQTVRVNFTYVNHFIPSVK